MTWIRDILELSYNIFPLVMMILYWMQNKEIKELEKRIKELENKKS